MATSLFSRALKMKARSGLVPMHSCSRFDKLPSMTVKIDQPGSHNPHITAINGPWSVYGLKD